MKIIIISYGDLNYDGRLRSLTKAFEKLGEVYSFTRGTNPSNENSKVFNGNYLFFIAKAIKFAKEIHNIDVLLLDNRRATIPGLFIRKNCKPKIVIQDCRELYLIDEVKHLRGKIGCVFESIMIKKSDVVICANKERAQIMHEKYNLKNEPISYENLRKLEYSSEDAKAIQQEKFSHYFADNEVRIISSSGCSISRTNDVLVENLQFVKRKCHLFLVGEYSEKEKDLIDRIHLNEEKDKVSILGRLNQDELKYLISQCHIGIVNYGQYDTNNKLCASGKIYEFLYEGIPVVTTTNPPLVNICQEWGIGISDDRYYDGINQIIDDYDLFKQKVSCFINQETVEKNDVVFIEILKKYLRKI